ncbi:nucleoid-associated protein [Lysinibacillus sp. FSL K6-4013]|uniref:nucleoid-associated protein n=1 Tax=Lysinibacillus sp. FSL K6-4013 TaxID=2921504 RepID=UPI00315A751F
MTVTQFASLHYIDSNASSTTQREVNTNDAISYVKQLIQETQVNPNKRSFAFKNSTTPLFEYVMDIFNQLNSESIENIFSSNCIKIAERLLLAEKETVSKYPNMQHPRKGSLIITADNLGDELLITLAKIETVDFLEDVHLKIQSGLPINKKALKTAVICITQLEDTEELEVQITVTDSGSTIAKYWSDDFLEASELTSDEKNTKNAFTAIERILSQNLKTQAPSDYTELRNGLVGYFKKQPSFHFENMIDYVFGNYEMENTQVNLENVKDKVKKLLEKEKFDTHFTIVPNEIKARFKKTYKVTDEIELRTNGHIENLRHIIKATKNTQGEKILEIKIESDTIYKSFEFNDVQKEQQE